MAAPAAAEEGRCTSAALSITPFADLSASCSDLGMSLKCLPPENVEGAVPKAFSVRSPFHFGEKAAID